jgi:hypothetical protein
VDSDVSYLVRDDQMMLGVDDNLRVVTHDTGDSSTRRHRAGIRIGERYLLIWSSQHLRLATFKTVHLLPSNYRAPPSNGSSWLATPPMAPVGRRCRAAAGMCDALLDLHHAPLHLGTGEVLIPLFTAFNLLPSIATLGSSNRPWRDRARQNPAQTWRMARPLSLRKSASGLSSVIQSSTHPGNSVPCSRSRTHRAGIVTRESLRAESFHTARPLADERRRGWMSAT